MGICLSCLRGRSGASTGETEPLLPVQSDMTDESTSQTRDLDAVISYVSENFVDIVNLESQPLTEPASLPPLAENWVWPGLGPLGEQDEQLLDQTYNSLKSVSAISLATPTPLTTDLS